MVKTEFIVSTSAIRITEKVNKWIEEHDDVGILIDDIVPFMSYANINDKGAMQIGCMIKYFCKDH